MRTGFKTASANCVRVPWNSLIQLGRTCLRDQHSLKRMLLIIAIVTSSIALALITS